MEKKAKRKNWIEKGEVGRRLLPCPWLTPKSNKTKNSHKTMKMTKTSIDDETFEQPKAKTCIKYLNGRKTQVFFIILCCESFCAVAVCCKATNCPKQHKHSSAVGKRTERAREWAIEKSKNDINRKRKLLQKLTSIFLATLFLLIAFIFLFNKNFNCYMCLRVCVCVWMYVVLLHLKTFDNNV